MARRLLLQINPLRALKLHFVSLGYTLHPNKQASKQTSKHKIVITIVYNSFPASGAVSFSRSWLRISCMVSLRPDRISSSNSRSKSSWLMYRGSSLCLRASRSITTYASKYSRIVSRSCSTLKKSLRSSPNSIATASARLATRSRISDSIDSRRSSWVWTHSSVALLGVSKIHRRINSLVAPSLSTSTVSSWTPSGSVSSSNVPPRYQRWGYSSTKPYSLKMVWV
mmetsp:Transcript_21998/g.61181  ORF Transcript_21998/g.61181 Transcript_21998/m.61181 type:complete len:225 (-) Transcript_21998:1326-2000(-)